MITVRVDADYHGPTIMEIESLLDQSQKPIEVKWRNSNQEIAILQRHRERNAVLIVQDLKTKVLTNSAVGGKLDLPPGLLAESMIALNGKGLEWRTFVEKVGSEVAFAAILQNTSNRIRQGELVDRSLRAVIHECLFDGVSPIDMDVLLSMRLSGFVPDE